MIQSWSQLRLPMIRRRAPVAGNICVRARILKARTVQKLEIYLASETYRCQAVHSACCLGNQVTLHILEWIFLPEVTRSRKLLKTIGS